MSNPRWKYKTQEVKVGDNSQTVREMTHRDYQDFFKKSKDVKAGNGTMLEVMVFVVSRGCVNPEATVEDVEQMPTDLVAACSTAILKLSGVESSDEKEGEEGKNGEPTAS